MKFYQKDLGTSFKFAKIIKFYIHLKCRRKRSFIIIVVIYK